jgi:formamidopyrimidine-DNA glycosylase
VPELPEVEVVRAGLEPALSGATILGVEALEPRSLRRHDTSLGSFEELLVGQRLRSPVRRGKFLWVPFATEPSLALLIHLGMSGQVLVRDPGAALDERLRVRIVVDHPEHGELAIHFVDQRIFGSMSVDRLVATRDGFPGGRGTAEPLIPGMAVHIARDPLDPDFDDAGFLDALHRKKTGVKRALLDQTLISGVGNIYADEALWAARVHYATLASELPRPRAGSLLAEVRLVLSKALAEGGTSFDAQYVNVNGASGYFSHSLNVYGRQGQPCPRCGQEIVREQFMNRSSHLCRNCQRLRYRRPSIR